MDLSSILGVQGRMPGRPSQTSSGDFSDELNKEMPREAPKPSGEYPPRERAGLASEPSASDALAATQDAQGSVLDPLVVSDTHALSAIASVEQVLSARVFGLHLQASGYLSEYQLASGDNQPPASHGEVSAVQAEELPAVSPSAGATLTTPEPEDSPGPDPGTMGMANLALPEIAAASSTEIEPVAMPLSGDAAWRQIMWQQRALRLIARPDGRHTVWLRDFSVSTDEARQLAVSVARQLKGQGLALHNIFWNGHEVWSSVDVD